MEYISACTLDCPDCCSVIITKDETSPPTIKGNPAHPVTKGFTCQKAKHALSRIAAPDRITTPLLREGSSFIEVSWETALTTIARKIASLQESPERMLHIRGYGFRGVLADTSRYLFRQLGASATRGALCDNAIMEAAEQDFGTIDQNNYTELLNADCIVNWGRDVLRSSIHTATLLKEARANGCKMLSISPVSTKEGMRIHVSDTHIQIRPGTDRFFAAAIIKRLVEGGISDSIINRISNGSEFIDYINTLNEPRLLQACGASKQQLDLATEIFGNENMAVSSIVGWGLQRYTYGGENVRYINALCMLSGNVGKRGAGSYCGFCSNRNFNTAWRSGGRNARKLLLPRLADEIFEAGDIDFLWCEGTNIVNQAPDAANIAKAFRTVGMVVVVDAFMTDTAKRADIILPCALMHEREEVLASYYHSYVQYSAKVFDPAGEARSTYDIANDLAQRLDMTLPDKEDILAQALSTEVITNLTPNPLQAIRSQGYLSTDRNDVAFENMKFGHFDGKYCCPEALHDEPETNPNYPLSLQSLINKEYEHSQIPEEAQQEVLAAYVHPETLARFNIAGERQAYIVSPVGKLPVKTVPDSSVHPESVVVRRGGWMMFNRCANAIIEAHITDLGENAAFYSQKVRLEPM